jgi:hypothetical protein
MQPSLPARSDFELETLVMTESPSGRLWAKVSFREMRPGMMMSSGAMRLIHGANTPHTTMRPTAEIRATGQTGR